LDLHDCGPQRVSLPVERWWHDLGELGEGSLGVLLHASDAAGLCSEQTSRNRDHVSVVEHQRRHLRAGREAVAAGCAAVPVDAVAEHPQPRDVVANRSGRDAEPFCELSAAPRAGHLEQGEKIEKPSRRGF
jgi:hypothetical protein